MSSELVMELRRVTPEERLIVGVVAPYDETTYLTGDPRGERIRRGAFTRSLQHRAGRVPLLRNHDRARKLGTSRSFEERPEGLVGEFVINEGEPGNELLEECRHGYLDALSVGFAPIRTERASDGALEVLEAKLGEVSMVAVPAYEGAAMLAVRAAVPYVPELPPRPDVNLAPIPPIVYGAR